MPIDTNVFVTRLLLAAALSAALGLEREIRHKPAGLRTNMLIGIGSFLFTIVSMQFAGGTGSADRIAAQVVTGIGFLGAGAIIREGISVRGLTTAASLWIVAAIGMASGAGYYWPAVAGTALTVFALWPLRALAYRTIERLRPPERRLVVELREGSNVKRLLDMFGDVRQVEVEDERDRRIVTVVLEDEVDEQLVSKLSDLDDVIAVRWRT